MITFNHVHTLCSQVQILDTGTQYSKPGVLQGRVHRLLGRLGNPQHTLPVVHIAGSKGKGSVAVMLAAILQAAGYKVAAYTRRATASLTPPI